METIPVRPLCHRRDATRFESYIYRNESDVPLYWWGDMGSLPFPVFFSLFSELVAYRNPEPAVELGVSVYAVNFDN